MSDFFKKQVYLRTVILAGIGVLVVIALLWWWSLAAIKQQQPTANPLPQPIGNNVLNPDLPNKNPEPVVDVNRDFDIAKLFSAIQVGMTKDDLFAAAAVRQSNCSTFQVPTLGAEELCTWINNDKVLIFTILNNQIIAKSKRGF